MVANAIPDQAATVGTAFSYQFPATTFNDTDGTDTLTYSAKQADDSALPTWLTFTDTTRTFSGNPTAAGTVSVKVTASDGTASVSDEFDITVQFTTFISNTGQSSSHASAQVRATAFTTGTGTYTLSSVRIYHGLQSSVTPQVQIYSDASGEPGTVVATMSNLGTIALGVNIYPAPANTTLSASTIYWVVTSNSAATDGQGFRVNTTPTNNLDSGTAAGWNIGNARYKDDITATSWSAISGERLRFQIRGTAGTTTNTAAAGAPAITAPNVFRVPAVLGVDLSGITDTDGVTEHRRQRHLQVAAVQRGRDDAGYRQHRNQCYLHPDRHGRDQDAEGGGQLHRRRQQQRGTADQRRNLSHHRGSKLRRAHLRWRGGADLDGEGGRWEEHRFLRVLSRHLARLWLAGPDQIQHLLKQLQDGQSLYSARPFAGVLNEERFHQR